MYCIARNCTSTFGRNGITKLLQSRQPLFTHNLRTVLTSRTSIFAKRNPFVLQKGWLQKHYIKSIGFATQPAPQKGNKAVGTWLLVCSGMVFVAVALGGITRLTESGLSMVTWTLLGEKRPSTDEEWAAEFERYKQYPEYKMINYNMTVQDFKRIYYMEYVHRMWGRLIGVVYALPALYFWTTGKLCRKTQFRVGFLGCLIGLQGLLGWYMVKSGLEDRFQDQSDVPRVSQYRLASHLGLALLIYVGFLNSALDHLTPAKPMDMIQINNSTISLPVSKTFHRFKKLVYSLKGLVFVTALSGAFVAGMDAGLIYNSFPKMADKWIPEDILSITPVFLNFTENPTTVQFDHRILGITTLSAITLMAVLSRKHTLPGNAKKAVVAALCAGYLQALLGITTLLHHVPVALAACHQSGSLLLLSTMVWLCHEMKLVKYVPK